MKQISCLTESQLNVFLNALLSTYNTPSQRLRSLRNYGLALVMCDAGLRVGEAVQLILSDLWYFGKPVAQLRVRHQIAKNNKERIIPVTSRLRLCIDMLAEHYWSDRLEFGQYTAFCGSNVTGFLSSRQVERIFVRIGEKSLRLCVTPHMLRHTFANRVRKITDIRTLQVLLGHSNLSSTQIYTHPNSEDTAKAISAMDHERISKQKYHYALKSGPCVSDCSDASLT